MIEIGRLPDERDLQDFAASAVRDGRELVVGAVVADPAGRLFVQRRSPDRELFPGAWDLVGGHAEPGEGVRAALARELEEETGWTLRALGPVAWVLDWEAADRAKREIDLIVEADGVLSEPRLEPGKHTGFRWLRPADLPLLLEARDPADRFVHDVAASAFRILAARRGREGRSADPFP